MIQVHELFSRRFVQSKIFTIGKNAKSNKSFKAFKS